MRSFIRRHLDPASRLGEMLFGLIMALCFGVAVRFGQEEADSRALFVAILGCNVAWGLVDAVMHVLNTLFERGRRARLFREVRAAAGEDAALRRIGEALDERIEDLLGAQRARIVGARPLRVVGGLTLLGVVLVCITVVLGG
jgi:hypothetical protein